MIRRGSRSLDQLVKVGGSGHCTAAAAGMIGYNERNPDSGTETNRSTAFAAKYYLIAWTKRDRKRKRVSLKSEERKGEEAETGKR